MTTPIEEIMVPARANRFLKPARFERTKAMMLIVSPARFRNAKNERTNPMIPSTRYGSRAGSEAAGIDGGAGTVGLDPVDC
jgi:hypothetical protein